MRYDCNIHSHVTITHPNPKEPLCYSDPAEIILHTGNRVIVKGSYLNAYDDGVLRVGDGTSNGFDEHGGCLLSFPVEWCQYHSFEEAEQIMMAQKCDEQLMGYM